jgi:hypothetical protein
LADVAVRLVCVAAARFDALVDVTSALKITAQIRFGGSNRRAQTARGGT